MSDTGNFRIFGLADISFDVILMNDVIEHEHNPIGLLRECYRILRPGGRLAMVKPNSEI
jgi:2-polyprenyl-3-methyl-5-hydroxy-6-metoxy-1,4-benzoquinol methylase